MLIELLTKKYPGMRLWLTQRISAVVMATILVLFLLRLVVKQPTGYQGWVSVMTPWWWRGLTLIFFVSLFAHAWLGVRDVFKDYVFNLTLRSWLQVIVDILLIVYLCVVVNILWGI